ncbi:hypothetical protein Agabi119p4_5731 [Agaricus bisporus var. burnettii]|uniref:Uncharacterized protein n=1 Tax=Agaricus bisporus var. burnettii TaxID=192524 RepID=A0A8H7KGU0_AGABI|nr:hypothetical protein Agabi119p4_5731 [Agaricus bisporus var. burnettii]
MPSRSSVPTRATTPSKPSSSKTLKIAKSKPQRLEGDLRLHVRGPLYRGRRLRSDAHCRWRQTFMLNSRIPIWSELCALQDKSTEKHHLADHGRSFGSKTCSRLDVLDGIFACQPTANSNPLPLAQFSTRYAIRTNCENAFSGKLATVDRSSLRKTPTMVWDTKYT